MRKLHILASQGVADRAIDRSAISPEAKRLAKTALAEGSLPISHQRGDAHLMVRDCLGGVFEVSTVTNE